jgi:hypothetical protein
MTMKRIMLRTSAALTLLSVAGSLSASEIPNAKNVPPSAFQQPISQHQQQNQNRQTQPRIQKPQSPENSILLQQGKNGLAMCECW